MKNGEVVRSRMGGSSGNLSPLDGLCMLGKGVRNYLTRRPLIISLEVTLSCNCNCRHCDLGGMRKGEKRIGPRDYAGLVRRFQPLLVQISGGEPLLREDIVDVVHAIKEASRLTYVILVTNGALLNEDIYLRLRTAGLDQLSVSLDFADQRHDDFRRHRGLYRHLEQTVPVLAAHGNKDVILNTAITRANYKDALVIARTAREWGVRISYSAYTPLRTNDEGYMIREAEDIAALRATMQDIIQEKRGSDHIANSAAVLRKTLRFLEDGTMPGCQAGVRFFVVMPDGALVPCSLHRQRFESQREMIERFSRTNSCGGCYVAIRSYSDRSLGEQIRDLPHFARQTFPALRA
ncbi:MAG: radical SAM protein [Chloroflexota bacterium]